MLYLIEFHWPWLFVALLLGGAVAWLGFSRAQTRWWDRWVAVAGALAVLALGLAVFAVLPGRVGYALDLGLLMLVSYIIGCLLGTLLHRALGWAPARAAAPVIIETGSLAAPTAAQDEADRRATARAVAERAGAEQAAAQAQAERQAAAAAVALAQTQPQPQAKLQATPQPQPQPRLRTRLAEPPVRIPVGPPARAPVGPLVFPGRKPPVLDGPLGLGKDDLTLIKGIGPKSESILNGLGIFHFCQIADWSAGEAEWIGHAMAIPGRIEREHWIEQAEVLCAGGVTEHAIAIRSGKLAPSDEALSAAEGARLQTTLTEASHRGRKPPVLAAPTGGVRDDLKQIRGVGPRSERVLNDLGIFHFCQIADWTAPEAQWIGHAIAFPGRAEREHWIEQAKILCRGGETDHSRAVRAGLVHPGDAALSAGEAARIKAGLVLAALPGVRPPRLSAPLDGKADDLPRIDGIDQRDAGRLHDFGIFHFRQIAGWTEPEAEWIGHALEDPGRVERQDWVEQARILVKAAAAAEFTRRDDAATPGPSQEGGDKE